MSGVDTLESSKHDVFNVDRSSEINTSDVRPPTNVSF